MKTKVYAIMAAYNEEKNIGAVVDKVKKYVDVVIVIDDGSKDKTSNVSKKGVIVLKHLVNLGKGSALKTGCEFAIKDGANVLILLDADGQHDPTQIPEFLRKLRKNDIVLAYRKLNKQMPTVLRIGNWIINKTIRFLYGIGIKDSQCGYRAFTTHTYKKLRWKSSDYSVESEMIANIGKYNLRFDEIQIGTIYSDKYKGTNLFDGLKIVFNLFMWRLGNR
jgi:glycosyltransferase involved in cell wall biosynthesis